MQAYATSFERRLNSPLLLTLLLSFPLSATSQTPTQPHPGVNVSELVGVWKICYEPDLEGVDEVSSGYLVLMPDGRYFEHREDCCPHPGDPPNVGISNTYTIHENEVTFQVRQDDGTEYELKMHYRTSAEVVLFDDLEGPAGTFPLLTHQGTLNYCYAKVYPKH